MPVKCSGCGQILHVRPVQGHGRDWVRVVCNGCGGVEFVSLVRLRVRAEYYD